MTATSPFAHRPWLDSYPPEVPHEIPKVTQTLTEMMVDAVKRYGKKPALEFFGRTTSYDELGDQIDRAAEGLRRMGVRHGDRVAIILPNCPQHIVAFYAVLRLGAIVVEHNPLYTARELRTQFEDHEAKYAIVWDKVADLVADFSNDILPDAIVSVDMTEAMPTKTQLLLRLPVAKARESRAQLTTTPRARDLVQWKQLLKHRHIARRVPHPALDDLAVLQYTSGTTGTAKAAKLTHANLRANAMQGRAWVFGMREGRETVYAVLPMFHAYGLTLCLTFSMSSGAKLVLFPKFDLQLTLDAAKKSPPTFLPAVPPVYDQLTRAAADGKIDLTSVQFALSGAMSQPVALVERWEALSGGVLVEGYGMTETSPVAVGNPMGPSRRPGTVGIPFPSTEIRVVDPEQPNVDLPVGDVGELLIR